MNVTLLYLRNYMAIHTRYRLFLTSLLLLLSLQGNNAYAWYCNYTPTPEGYMLPGSLVCNGIDPQIALKDYWCVSYRPDDPLCGAYQAPTCSDLVESQTTACTLPHYSGAINQSRNFSCSTNSWSPWTETSNNCTQDPPTCQASSETRQLACQADYVGSVTETRNSSCPDPYGNDVWGAWIETANSCVKSATNVTNVSSPVSPSSPLNPINNPPPIAAPPPPAGLPANSPGEPVLSSPLPVKVEQPKQEAKSEPKTKEDSPKDPPKAEQKNESKDSPKLDVPKGKELVHGFGIVLSLEILNKPIIQQIELTDAFKFDTEINNEFGKTQNLQLELIQLGTSQDAFIGSADISWKRIRRHNFLQQDGFGN
jgi:hypothetical protein